MAIPFLLILVMFQLGERSHRVQSLPRDGDVRGAALPAQVLRRVRRLLLRERDEAGSNPAALFLPGPGQADRGEDLLRDFAVSLRSGGESKQTSLCWMSLPGTLG